MSVQLLVGTVESDDSPIRVFHRFPAAEFWAALECARTKRMRVFVRDGLGDSGLDALALARGVIACVQEAIEAGADLRRHWGDLHIQAFEISTWAGSADHDTAWALWRHAWAGEWKRRAAAMSTDPAPSRA